MWKKHGLILDPKKYPFLGTHAALPIADKISDDKYRIYFTSRDKNNHSRVFFIEVNIHNLKQINKINSKPILTPGKLGSFDENGVMASSLITYNKKKYLYYIGWNKGNSIPFRWSIGLAISNDNGKSFKKFSEGPILDRNYIDPFMVSSPTVIFDNEKFKMYYISPIECKFVRRKFSAPYNIRYAESYDGINWSREGKIAINFTHKGEHAIGRASVIKEKNKYKMWYSYAIKNYRIGYAESKNGIHWKRMDKISGIDVSSSGWDSISIEYPYVFQHDSTKYMLYCGNEFGKTGFGYATMEQKS